MTVTTRKPATEPERKTSGTGSTGAITSSNLEALERKADIDGDYTKVIAEKRRLKRAQESNKK